MNYYVGAAIQVLDGGPLEAKDKFSFDAPPVETEADWEALLEKTFAEAEQLAERIERAVGRVLDDAVRTPDIQSEQTKVVGTQAMGDAVVAALRAG